MWGWRRGACAGWHLVEQTDCCPLLAPAAPDACPPQVRVTSATPSLRLSTAAVRVAPAAAAAPSGAASGGQESGAEGGQAEGATAD